MNSTPDCAFCKEKVFCGDEPYVRQGDDNQNYRTYHEHCFPLWQGQEIDRLQKEVRDARMLLSPVSPNETLCGAILNLQQAHLSEKGNAEEAEAELAAEREKVGKVGILLAGGIPSMSLEAHAQAVVFALHETRTALVKATAALARADALVQSIEWNGHTETYTCPCCGSGRTVGHTADCALVAFRDRKGGTAQKPKEWECVCGHHYNAHRPDNHCQDCDCRGYVDGPASAELKGGAA